MEALRQSAQGDSEARAKAQARTAERRPARKELSAEKPPRRAGLRVGAGRGSARSFRARSQRANESRSSALITRSAGMPLLRAIARPQRVEEAISRVEWASGLMLNLQPRSSHGVASASRGRAATGCR